MDLNEAKVNLESGDLAKVREAVDFLKTAGDAECVEALKRVRSSVPIFETNLIQQIDSAIFEIGRRTSSVQEGKAAAAAPVQQQEPASQVEPAKQVSASAAQPQTASQAQNEGSAQGQQPPQEAPAGQQAQAGAEPDGAGGQENGANGDEYPQNEYLEKVKDIWEKGKKNANIIMLRSKLNSIKNDKLIQIKHLGEKTFDFYKDNPPAVAFISDQIAKVRDIDAQIAKKQLEQKEIEEYKAEGGFWNMFKASISKMAGYTKIKLDISIFQTNRHSKLSAFGQLLYDKLPECEQYLKSSPEISGILDTIADLENQRRETENEIANLSR